MSDPIIEGFRGMSTANISDALDRLSLPGSAFGISPLQNGQKMIGRAFTIQYVPLETRPVTVGDYIDDIGPDEVIVLDNDGRSYCTVWGDILTAVAHHRGVAGTAINGVCRDVYRALELHYPIYSCGRFMRTGKDRVEVGAMNAPVALGDVRVRPNDLIIGDDDGIVVVPFDREADVLEVARGVGEVEDRIIEEALNGVSLRVAREHHGYHVLQRKGS